MLLPQAELVELLKGLESALSLHVQLEAPPHETGDSAPMNFDAPSSTGSAAFSHLKTLAERVALVRHPLFHDAIAFLLMNTFERFVLPV